LGGCWRKASLLKDEKEVKLLKNPVVKPIKEGRGGDCFRCLAKLTVFLPKEAGDFSNDFRSSARKLIHKAFATLANKTGADITALK